MKGYSAIIASDKIIRYGTLFSIIIIIAVFLYAGLLFTKLPPVLPLYNQMPWGADRLGSKVEFFILPAVALCILMLNTFLSSLFYSKMPLISRALTITCLLVSLIIGIFVFRTVQLVL